MTNHTETTTDEPSTPLPDHPLACIFPMMPEADLAALAEDIQIHGQRAPITILDSQILDGRNRYRACLLIGVEPITRPYRGDDPLQFVLSANLHRRHLSESQRALVAAKIANVPHGGFRVGAGRSKQEASLPLELAGGFSSGGEQEASLPLELAGGFSSGGEQEASLPLELAGGFSSGGEQEASLPLESAGGLSSEEDQAANLPLDAGSEVSIEKAAASMNVSPRSVRTARTVLKDPELAQAVEAGQKTVSAAAREMRDKAAGTEPNEVVRDSTGYAIPKHLIPLWNRAGEVFEIQKIIARAKRLVKAAHANEEDRLWSGASMQSIGDQLHSAQRALDGVIPYAVCATCQGHSLDQCMHCRGKGFLSKHVFDRTVPEELKAIRAKSCVLAR